MPEARKRLISLEATPYYHCISRCVRRAFLCGYDKSTGKSYEHRRKWIEQRLLELGSIFAIDVCSYAVMSNHTHVVLHINQATADHWDDLDVVDQWHKVFSGTFISTEFLAGRPLKDHQLRTLKKDIKKWKSRLLDISWFMRCLNEPIARAANVEDDCTGRFWEGRFISQALLDEKALVSCMAYVDLNPIRSDMAKTPESSEYTSVKCRSKAARAKLVPNRMDQQPETLYPFAGNPKENMPDGLPFKLTDYLELVEWTGRQIREDKRGSISTDLSPILNRLNLDPKNWMYLSTQFESRFKSFVGTVHHVRQCCEKFKKQWTHGLKSCEELFSSG